MQFATTTKLKDLPVGTRIDVLVEGPEVVIAENERGDLVWLKPHEISATYQLRLDEH